jgi:sugar-specific transcriptional regulator TrmB
MFANEETLKNILTEIGLSSYKRQTYLALIKIGSGTIQQIAKNSKVPACKIYENLKWLYENGYISLVVQKPLTYRANNPNIILKSEINKRKEQLITIEKELSQFKPIFIEDEKDIVQITNSREAFFNKMKEAIINSKNSISYSVKNWSTDAEIWRLLNESNKKGVKIRCLGPINEKNEERIKELSSVGVKTRNFNPPTTRFSIFDKKTVVLRLRKEESSYYSIWIKSEILAEILENYFDIVWNNSKK